MFMSGFDLDLSGPFSLIFDNVAILRVLRIPGIARLAVRTCHRPLKYIRGHILKLFRLPFGRNALLQGPVQLGEAVVFRGSCCGGRRNRC